eukprot:CAMPEP_0194738402 /NCGR_PEP_ID=MMETSP0296-20130528/84793_1 /TAXON_ID=39354 /ORGANISM="Heterosigma akashiwo, Strain CCMP2393" /LENGTH=69 /DNA_ID=CAMNT_0039648731 /DNA_START=110 /DNA_END=315 /DNA_ORIENTATION=+
MPNDPRDRLCWRSVSLLRGEQDGDGLDGRGVGRGGRVVAHGQRPHLPVQEALRQHLQAVVRNLQAALEA